MQTNKKRNGDLYSEFYNLNRPYWNFGSNKENAHGNILVYIVGNFINPAVNTMLFTKKYQESHPCKIIVGYLQKLTRGKKKVFSSFCVDGFCWIPGINMYGIIRTLLYVPMVMSCDNGDKLLRLKIDSDVVPVGEEIYDWILRLSELLTIDRISTKIRIKTLKYIYTYFSFLSFVTKKNIDTFIYTDCDYIGSAFTKVCQKKNIKMFNVFEGFANLNTKAQGFKPINPVQITHSKFKKFVSLKNYQSIVKKECQERFSGTRLGYLDSVAYRGKRMYTKNELLELYNLKDDKKNVLIASHALSDAPHKSYGMIFKDYHDWLVQTIRILSQTDKYNIFVKEHPSAKIYGEEGVVGDILREEGITNIYKIPDDLSTLCLFDIIDCFVTCCGTIGIEAACFGLPVVTAAKGYYYGYGLDYNCSDMSSYESCLKNLENLEKRPEITELAKIILGIPFFTKWNVNQSSLLVDRDLFTRTDYFFNDSKPLEALNQNLRNHSPKDAYYESLMDNIFVLDDSCCPDKLKNDFHPFADYIKTEAAE